MWSAATCRRFSIYRDFLYQHVCAAGKAGASSRTPKKVPYRHVECLLRLKLLDRFQENVAGDGERFGTDFVERILRSVPVAVIQEVADDIHRGHASLQEGIVVILGGCSLI